jgi:hypothetical protein
MTVTTFVIMSAAVIAIASGAGLALLMGWAAWRALGRLLLPRG